MSRIQAGLLVVQHIIQSNQLRVIAFGDVDVQLLVQPDQKIESVH